MGPGPGLGFPSHVSAIPFCRYSQAHRQPIQCSCSSNEEPASTSCFPQYHRSPISCEWMCTIFIVQRHQGSERPRNLPEVTQPKRDQSRYNPGALPWSSSGCQLKYTLGPRTRSEAPAQAPFLHALATAAAPSPALCAGLCLPLPRVPAQGGRGCVSCSHRVPRAWHSPWHQWALPKCLFHDCITEPGGATELPRAASPYRWGFWAPASPHSPTPVSTFSDRAQEPGAAGSHSQGLSPEPRPHGLLRTSSHSWVPASPSGGPWECGACPVLWGGPLLFKALCLTTRLAGCLSI